MIYTVEAIIAIILLLYKVKTYLYQWQKLPPEISESFDVICGDSEEVAPLASLVVPSAGCA